MLIIFHVFICQQGTLPHDKFGRKVTLFFSHTQEKSSFFLKNQHFAPATLHLFSTINCQLLIINRFFTEKRGGVTHWIPTD